MANCAKCGTYSKRYVLCINCLKKLKKEAWDETIIEFEKQYALTNKNEQSEIYRHSCYELWHNSFYEKLTKEDYKNRLFQIFSEIYFEKLVGCKLYTIKTGLSCTPNEKKYDLYY